MKKISARTQAHIHSQVIKYAKREMLENHIGLEQSLHNDDELTDSRKTEIKVLLEENKELKETIEKSILEDVLELDNPSTPKIYTAKDFPLPEILEFAKKEGGVFSEDLLNIPGLESLDMKTFNNCLICLAEDNLGDFTIEDDGEDNELESYCFMPYKGFDEDGEPVYYEPSV